MSGIRTSYGVQRFARVALVALLAVLCLWTIRAFVVPVAWAVIIGIAIWPLYQRRGSLRGRHRARLLAPLIATLLVGALLVLPLALAAVELTRELPAAVHWLANVQRSGLPPPPWLAQLPLIGGRLLLWWRDHLADPRAGPLQHIDIAALASWTGALGAQLAYRSLLFFVALLTLFFILRDGERMRREALDAARRLLGEGSERLVEAVVSAIRGTVVGTVLVALGEGTLIGIGYAVTGVPQPVLFGLLTVAFAMLPMGAWVAFSIAALLLLVHGHVLPAIGLVAFGSFVMLVGDNVVQPALVGGAARLPFLLAFVGTIGGLQSFGLVGLFLGPAIMAAALLLWHAWSMGAPADNARNGG